MDDEGYEDDVRETLRESVLYDEYKSGVFKAIEWTMIHHAGQTRSGSNVPYAVHPMRVLNLVQSVGVDDCHVLIATIGHDWIEDTKVTLHDIEEEFGYESAKIITELTNDNTLSKKDKKKKMIEKAATVSNEARLIKAADRIDNLSDMEGMPEGFIVRYLKESHLLRNGLKAGFRGLDENLVEMGYEPFKVKEMLRQLDHAILQAYFWFEEGGMKLPRNPDDFFKGVTHESMWEERLDKSAK